MEENDKKTKVIFGPLMEFNNEKNTMTTTIKLLFPQISGFLDQR
jgi:hypothetical protein